MIRLIKRVERRDIDLGFGVTVTVRPVTTWIHRAAQHSAERMVRQLAYEGGLIEAAGGSIHDIPDLHKREGMLGRRDQLTLQALARHVIIEWQGVAGEDGAPVSPTPEVIDALIRDHPAIAASFEVEYLRELTAMYAEGNGSGAAATGTSAAAPATADVVPS
jgi:hypothetical protein